MESEEYIHATTAEEAEQNLLSVIKKYGLEKHTSISAIRNFILKDRGGDARTASNQYFKMVFSILEHANEHEADEALQAFVDAWNWFPHAALDGKSPEDMLQEAESDGKSGEFMAGFSPVHIFGELYRLARTRALREHKRLRGTQHEFARIENMLGRMHSAADEQRTSEFITMHGIDLLRRVNATIPETIELFMRETQAMINHSYVNSQKEGIGSILLGHAMNMVIMSGTSPLDFDIPLFITILLEAHQVIDTYAEKHTLDYRVSSVAHHVLDWLAMENPWIIVDEHARKLSALAYGIVERVHEAVTGETAITGTKEELMHLGGWKSPKKFASELSDAFIDVVYAVQDPHMLIPYAEEAPDDWFAKLKTIAPELESEWDDSDRPPPGSIPSPFF